MSKSIQCFWLEPTDQVKRFLRRYRGSDQGEPCPLPQGYHNAMVELDRATAEVTDNGGINASGTWPKEDPRWPKQCACGYAFVDEDQWQLFINLIYRRQDTGEETTLRDAPPGAMWDATWFRKQWVGPDGIHLVVKTPGGEWYVDGPSHNSRGEGHRPQGWARTGALPNVTATPSILIPGKYHGWLRDGYLVEC